MLSEGCVCSLQIKYSSIAYMIWFRLCFSQWVVLEIFHKFTHYQVSIRCDVVGKNMFLVSYITKSCIRYALNLLTCADSSACSTKNFKCQLACVTCHMSSQNEGLIIIIFVKPLYCYKSVWNSFKNPKKI